ncbi:MAG: TIGR03620 family F420-dependent LLM class oxidoreductase [bacterium]|jgi:probable F420-dependent oxidoreductase|nr:TIGR03620 family F420-dependent LLM class oxidoreductase [bacterium]
MGPAEIEEARRRLGRVGVWTLDVFMAGATPADEERRAVARIEELGYGSLWFAEAPGGKDAFAQAAILLAASERIVIAPGIANVRAREATAMQGATVTLAEAYPDRFVLGVGGATKAVFMREYLEDMDAATGSPMAPRFAPVADRDAFMEEVRAYMAGTWQPSANGGPAVPVARVLAALGPKMLEVARDHADGAHPFSAPVAHTRLAREALGPDKLLVPEQPVVFDTDRERAHERARATVLGRKTWPDSPYNANLRRLGYGDEDLAGSERLVSDLVAWGDEEAIAARVREQLEAGADHVLVHPLGSNLAEAVAQLERLAPALTELAG